MNPTPGANGYTDRCLDQLGAGRKLQYRPSIWRIPQCYRDDSVAALDVEIRSNTCLNLPLRSVAEFEAQLNLSVSSMPAGMVDIRTLNDILSPQGTKR